MKMNAQPVRGTKDYLPQEVEIRDYIRSQIENVYQSFGFHKIATPIMEDIERLNKSDGGENLAMIFKLLKRGQKLDLSKENLAEDDLVDSGLRYDLTMPLSRYYANNSQFLNLPFKAIQIDKVFRAERPQKGRLREFFQCDIDIIGDNSIQAEMELIAATTSALNAIGFSDFTIRLNDRRILTDMILAAGFKNEDVAAVCIIFDKLDKIGLDGVRTELLERQYSTDIVEKFLDILSAAETDPLAAAEKFCTQSGVVTNLKYVLDFAQRISNGQFHVIYDKSLVRGMGYYTGMVFEIVSPKFGSSVAGGGRYDEMVGKFLGESVPAVGFSIGFERICSILLEEGFVPPRKEKIVLAYNDEDDFAEVIIKAQKLRAVGKIVTMLKRSKKFGKQLDALIANGATKMVNFSDDSQKNLG
ncbi:histidine--tRNA ligase [bacterium]|nr:histidine--tRNA ligase [bacterium]MBR2273610.1 histidine--tRNA ligase [Alphaproteobacteria bacterium]